MATPVHEDEFAQPEDKSQGEQTITVRADVQDIPVDSYHPKKWQSNITILSCVSEQVVIERHERVLLTPCI